MQTRSNDLATILANDPIYQKILAACEAMPKSAPKPIRYTGPTYITGTSARLAKANRAALAGMVERAKADGRPEIIKAAITAAIARIEANRAAHERGCTPAHCRGLNLFDYVEALAALREAA